MSLCIGSANGRTNNFPESRRGLGHVTLTIFGSTVGYPSDSLASCLCFIWSSCHTNLIQYIWDEQLLTILFVIHYLYSRYFHTFNMVHCAIQQSCTCTVHTLCHTVLCISYNRQVQSSLKSNSRRQELCCHKETARCSSFFLCPITYLL